MHSPPITERNSQHLMLTMMIEMIVTAHQFILWDDGLPFIPAIQLTLMGYITMGVKWQCTLPAKTSCHIQEFIGYQQDLIVVQILYYLQK